jgi:hypothetical protein
VSRQGKGTALDQAYEQSAQLRSEGQEEFRKAVARQWRLGLTDHQILKALRGTFKVSMPKVKEAREACGLPPHPKGGAQ